MTRSTQLVIIGAGTAGLTALSEARRFTDDLLLINDGPYGTTCARVGCMPSKALLAVAHGLDQRDFLNRAGVTGSEALAADIPQVLRHVRELRARFVSGPIKLAEKLGGRSIQGRPRFLEADTLEVNGERIRFERAIIATGSRPVVPTPWQAFGARILTSDTLFEQTDLGPHGAVIGLGAIGAELGQGLAQLGLQVHGFNASPLVAGLSDPEVNRAMLQALEAHMPLTCGAEAQLEAAAGGRLRVSAGTHSVEVDWVLAALGRQPNLEGLGLETLRIELDARGSPRFDPCTLQLEGLPIYIAGDVSGLRPLMHEAADEGRIAAHHALAGHDELVGRRVPLAIVFTEPGAARVGLPFGKLEQRRHVVGEADFSQQPRALMAGRNQGRLHLYFERETARLVGAEMAVPEAEHLAHLLAWATQQRSTLDELLQMPFYHPTLPEGLRPALFSARKRLGESRTLPDIPLCHESADWALGGG